MSVPSEVLLRCRSDPELSILLNFFSFHYVLSLSSSSFVVVCVFFDSHTVTLSFNLTLSLTILALPVSGDHSELPQ